MNIDPRYIAARSMQQYLVDKDTGFPLANGYVKCYRDAARTEGKLLYQLTGNPENYTFVALPNPLPLNSVGTPSSDGSNDIIPYFLPYLNDTSQIVDLYYLEIYNQDNELQFTRQAFPPNVEESAQAGELINIPNFIPNGQFLAHNPINPEEDNLLLGGSTVIAPGGWTFELPDNVLSTNFLTFTPIQSWTSDPPASPPFSCNIVCTIPNTSDNIKSLRIKFNDANKFASDSLSYTFAFWGVSNGANTNVTIKVVKYFGVGGTSFSPVTIETLTIGALSQFYNVVIPFGDNAGATFGTGETYVAIDIAFNTTQAFNVDITDAVLSQGVVAITDYPVQTDADTLTRSINGWCETPSREGFDLGLSQVLTLKGMEYDHSVIGNLVGYDGPVGNPDAALTDNPPPIGILMPANGNSYPFNGFSTLGIPYARYGNFLLDTSPVTNVPRYGTGTNYATAYTFQGNSNAFRITLNKNGSSIPAASDGNTGWDFGVLATYNGSTTGANSLNYIVSNTLTNTILAIANFPPPAERSATPGTTPFTVNGLNYYLGILAQQSDGFNVTATGASTLIVGSGSPAKYMGFGDATIDYYIWFDVTGEIDPAPGGYTYGIKVDLTAVTSATAQDVVNILRETISAFQSTCINVTNTAIASGSYFNFSTNPGALINYYVWYDINNQGGNPNQPGIGIRVPLPASPTATEIVLATQLAINTVQYASPNWEGMFPRGADFSGIYDKDVNSRLSNITGLSGANYGTYEYQQFLKHIHQYENAGVGGSEFNNGIQTGPPNDQVDATGGSETRPVNFYTNWCVKY